MVEEGQMYNDGDGLYYKIFLGRCAEDTTVRNIMTGEEEMLLLVFVYGFFSNETDSMKYTRRR